MKKVIKKKLEETKQHAFEKKVLQREKAKGAPRVGEFYKENDILLGRYRSWTDSNRHET